MLNRISLLPAPLLQPTFCAKGLRRSLPEIAVAHAQTLQGYSRISKSWVPISTWLHLSVTTAFAKRRWEMHRGLQTMKNSIVCSRLRNAQWTMELWDCQPAWFMYQDGLPLVLRSLP